MAATVETRDYTGSGPSSATCSNLRFKTADDNTQDTSNPLVVPSAGTNYSFWKTIALYCTVAPDNTISNVKLYSDGTLDGGASDWNDSTVNIGDQFTDTYVQATGTTGTTGDEVTANHSQISSVTDLFTYTSGSPVSITSASGWDNTTGRITAYVVLQVAIGTSQTAGTQGTETITWRYDET